MKAYAITRIQNSMWSALQLHHLCLFWVNDSGEPELIYDDTFTDARMIALILGVFQSQGWKDPRLDIGDLQISSLDYLGAFTEMAAYDAAVEKVCKKRG